MYIPKEEEKKKEFTKQKNETDQESTIDPDAPMNLPFSPNSTFQNVIYY
jgi:hypothetical protein